MLTAEQVEAAVRELVEECAKHPDNYSLDDQCESCRFKSFCDKFYPGDGATWHWRIDNEEVEV